MLSTPPARSARRAAAADARAADPEVRPVDYGADPTGATDSTAAFAAALAALLARNLSGGLIAPGYGVADLGGATLRLGGGDYVISAPLIIPPGFGNLRIAEGTLRASAAFPRDRALIEVGGTACRGGVDACNVLVTLSGLLLDGGLHARGCVLARGLFQGVFSQLYAVNFTGFGVAIHSGHEVHLESSWVAQVPLTDPRRENATFAAGSTGVLLDGNDHYLSDVVCFGAAVGLNVSGGANLVRGFHVWSLSSPSGGVGIAVSGGGHAWDTGQLRLEGVYLDGCPLLIAGPHLVSVQDSFFLCSGINATGAPWPQIIVDAARTRGAVAGLAVKDSQFSGGLCQPFAARNVLSLGSVTMSGNTLNGDARSVPGVEATVEAIATVPTTAFTVDFAPLLAFPGLPIARVAYSVMLDGAMFARHTARAPVGHVVTIETDVPVTGRVTITASQAGG